MTDAEREPPVQTAMVDGVRSGMVPTIVSGIAERGAKPSNAWVGVPVPPKFNKHPLRKAFDTAGPVVIVVLIASTAFAVSPFPTSGAARANRCSGEWR